MQKQHTVADFIYRLQQANTVQNLFGILAEFRKAEWSDEERSQIAKVYMRLLDNINAKNPPSDNTQNDQAAGSDGPVWYEKM